MTEKKEKNGWKLHPFFLLLAILLILLALPILLSLRILILLILLRALLVFLPGAIYIVILHDFSSVPFIAVMTAIQVCTAISSVMQAFYESIYLVSTAVRIAKSERAKAIRRITAHTTWINPINPTIRSKIE